MRRLLFLLFCVSCAWLATPDASAAPTRRYPLPGNHRPVYTYYRGSGRVHQHRGLFGMFQHSSGTRKAAPHRRGTR